MCALDKGKKPMEKVIHFCPTTRTQQYHEIGHWCYYRDERISSESDESAKLCELIRVFVCVSQHQTTITSIWQISIHLWTTAAAAAAAAEAKVPVARYRDESVFTGDLAISVYWCLLLSFAHSQQRFVSCNIIYIHSCFHCYSHLRFDAIQTERVWPPTNPFTCETYAFCGYIEASESERLSFHSTLSNVYAIRVHLLCAPRNVRNHFLWINQQKYYITNNV